MHSPFVFDFITKVMLDKHHYDEYNIVELLRKDLLNNHEEIQVKDFGAGSAVDKTGHRQVASIAKNAAKSKRFGQLLFRMVRYYKSSIILELGTSLGITTSYLSLANAESAVTTMEGAPAIASLAKRNFEKLGFKNIKIIEGNFDGTLSSVMDNLKGIDFAFIDGNHRFEPTIGYFDTIIKNINSHSIIVIDDIHWSADMEKAWQVIKNHESVQCSIDLFFIGIVFFREEFHEKQHFAIRF